MWIKKIDLENVRIIERASIKPQPGVNLLYGRNGSGKTSVLEAIHLLSRAKSFRSPKIQELVKKNQKALFVSAKIDLEQKGLVSVGISRADKQTKMRFQENPVFSISKQAAEVPVLVQTTDSHSLISGGPKQRRKWLDWFLFHVEPDYLLNWKKFHTALRNRNILLRQRNSESELTAWEEQMDQHGQELMQKSQETAELINQSFVEKTKQLADLDGHLEYRSSWDKKKSYIDTLKNNRAADRDRGYTAIGPHRADIVFFCDGEKAAKTLSRGQAKLYLSALILSEAKNIIIKTGKTPVLLFDDVAAELDIESRETIIEELNRSKIQSFISTTEPEAFEGHSSAMFHVERGEVNDVKMQKNEEGIG